MNQPEVSVDEVTVAQKWSKMAVVEVEEERKRVGVEMVYREVSSSP